MAEATIFVGPTRQYKLPSEAAAAAVDGDVIEIDAGVYSGDTAVWRANNLVIRGNNGGAHLDASGATIPNQKAIWVIGGDNTTIENIEFSGAVVPDRNGAGIRQEGTNLTVRNCYFHDNEMGILSGNDSESEIVVEYSEFRNHGKSNGGFSHNIYINYVKRFILRGSYSHHAEHGHTVKSRAHENYILYNRIMDEENGYSSYLIDLPNGGKSYIIGNTLHQGANSENTTMISFAAEGAKNPSQELYVVNNTFVNDRSNGRGIRIAGSPSAVEIVNNIFDGFASAVVNGSGNISNNFEGTYSGFTNRSNYDFSLESGEAIDAGIDPGRGGGLSLTPEWEYVHPVAKEKREMYGMLDIGAFEAVK
ncbi:MAG: right-handed parallel beta-helix repeat-containing protein [bacterium]|nr:right-handed parallel beta-helix repeat-containing protein [bacterium]